MNNKLLIFLACLLYFNNNYCVLGCMDNSFHLAVPNDYKQYHYVRCECPCSDIIAPRGKCRRCLHFGSPFRGEINTRQALGDFFR